MGNHKSVATAKLIFLDGAIQVYSSPVKVSHVLDQNPEWFVCNSDHLEYDDFVSAVDVDDELQVGQLYFALPVSWLEQPLQPEDMAALAVKASLALPKRGGGNTKCGCCFSRPSVDDDHLDPLMYSGEKYFTSRSSKVVAVGSEGGGVVEESRHTRKLSMIPEEASSSFDRASYEIISSQS